jgi:two-component system phosphate regulon sensor histidine kinase PhoR
MKAADVDALCKTVGEQLTTRITVILLSGLVLGDSMENPATMDNHANRPEIRAALAEHIGKSTRYSATLGREMMYVALQAERDGEIWGVVRASTSVAAIDDVLNSVYEKSIVGGIIVSLVAAIISFFVSYRINKPIADITQGAGRFADGELHHRLYVSGAQEITTLAQAMNRMASQLNERIDTVTRQRSDLEAMLGSMIEAVVVVDPEERILRCNQAAGRLFGFTAKTAEQRHIQEIIRNVDIQRFVKKTLAGHAPVEDVIVLNSGNEQFLRAHGTLLRTAAGYTTGAVLVFHNITRLKQLENVRREFVANVSHELKTPITSISGFVETLQDGAIDEPENAARFLDIIARNARRLNAIIEDLLSLSKIEQEEEQGHILLIRKPVKPVLEAAVMVCSKKAQDKQVAIELRCNAAVHANVNADLLEQAVINLLDNAIKYSEPHSIVTVRATQLQTDVVIAVEDSGCGIPRHHLPRLFERFYRVDKARSRKLGGTGLGLAITKHIVHAHQGTIFVDSTPGKGSTFSIKLPIV